MEKHSKNDLEKRSKEIFKLNRKANELHATEDGNFFEKKSDARNHNIKVVKGEVYSFYRDGIVPNEVVEESWKKQGATKEEVKVPKVTKEVPKVTIEKTSKGSSKSSQTKKGGKK